MYAGWVICCGITRRIFAGSVMTEIIEQVAFGTVSSEDWSCPFDHDSPPKRDDSIDNELIGIGTILGENMETGKSTLQYPGASKTDKVPYPDKGKYPIEIGDWCYAAVCAAHHLIPAQASLREASVLLDYMVSKHVAQDLKKRAPIRESFGPTSATTLMAHKMERGCLVVMASVVAMASGHPRLARWTMMMKLLKRNGVVPHVPRNGILAPSRCTERGMTSMIPKIKKQRSMCSKQLNCLALNFMTHTSHTATRSLKLVLKLGRPMPELKKIHN